MKVYIAHDVKPATMELIESELGRTQNYDCNFSGIEFEIVRDDTTFIDSDDLNAVVLYRRICGIIEEN